MFKKKVKKSFLRWESNPGPSTCKVSVLSVVPWQLMLNKFVEFIIFITFTREILPVDCLKLLEPYL